MDQYTPAGDDLLRPFQPALSLDPEAREAVSFGGGRAVDNLSRGVYNILMSENINQDLPNLPGTQLRQLRALNGLSLKELAYEAGSSPSAVHRYESGWGAFELRTLGRLAAALGARVEIILLPVGKRAAIRPPTRAQLVARLRPLFWDVDLSTAHLDQNPEWVLDRVLRFGDWEAVHGARLYFGDAAVRRAAGHRSMDERTRRFWQVVLGTEVARP